jgi:hypothetical protein
MRTAPHKTDQTPWIERFRTQLRTIQSPDMPIWWDGFRNVLLYRETSHPDDNPYTLNSPERSHYLEYRAGAKSAESLLQACGGMQGG